MRLLRGDGGFSLVELLVVIAIIGVLSAIGIGVFMGQRARAVDASVKSDLRTVATVVSGMLADGVPVEASSFGADVRVTPGNGVAVHVVGDSFCLVGRAVTGTRGTQSWVLDGEGLRDRAVSSCPGSAIVEIT
ncbi:prepilin-type N-terminal cleavage/methylation domain-containing protein [Flavimobilis soli]|uniref:Prepilin-type N-terminal cleavage/methylation domain-containing protein n=1 Tax=Flavimobilis soli TaxID=442709 RepID=A0A2A9E9L9_9MICO|nr:type II secretion system protein [Flavimobilis soli]PFG35648.1 prepilin-type N-terminal cleavage/methylation domain-containing protein [Flavimobilis soli]